MSIESRTITQRDPVLFRVASLTPFPVQDLPRPGWMVLTIITMPKTDHTREQQLHIPPEWFTPYVDAISQAIRSRMIYWVDLDFSKTPDFPPHIDDAVPQRILKAIGDGQIVHGQWIAEEP